MVIEKEKSLLAEFLSYHFGGQKFHPLEWAFHFSPGRTRRRVRFFPLTPLFSGRKEEKGGSAG
jgi:hypothetical protein